MSSTSTLPKSLENYRPVVRLPPPQYHARNINPNGPSYWATWPELGVKISKLPPGTTTRDLWMCFSQEGTIMSIDLYEDRRGLRDGKGCIRFRQPLASPFWESGRYRMSLHGQGTFSVELALENRRRTFLHPSPVNAQRKYQELMVMNAESLDFGVMINPVTMMRMHTVTSTSKSRVQFRQSMLHREITVEFEIDIQDPRLQQGDAIGPAGKYNRVDRFRFRLPFSQLSKINRVGSSGSKLILLISLEAPPKFFKELEAVLTHDDSARHWHNNDAWYRQTDIVYAPAQLKKSPLTLKKTNPIIDIGRWTTYRLVFDTSNKNMQQFDEMQRALSDYNVQIVHFPNLRLVPNRNPDIWKHIDKPIPDPRRRSTDMLELIEICDPPLSFEVRYQLEVCISYGFLNEYNLTVEFVNKLRKMESCEAQNLLEHVANQGKRMFDPVSLFDLDIVKRSALRVIPKYCTYTRSVTITPTTMYFQTPAIETSNRVIRQYSEYAERFLRVRFTDEKSEGKIFSTDKNTMNEVFTRIKRAMVNGITIGDRHYEFLAFGNSQFRDHGAYFFAPHNSLDTAKIRSWMGMFEDIKIVAKYASRLGQCFSTTRAIHQSATIVEIEDITRNGYNFTDGVGKISPFLAQMVALELAEGQPLSQPPPSVFQFRLGGCKGVLATSPQTAAQEIHIRRSQYKFPAMHEGLEIIRCSQFASANLNRQIILVLSALGVPDHVFVEKLKIQLSKLERAMTDEKLALEILQRDVDANQMTLTVAAMVLEGFQKTGEPFVTCLLQLWRAWSIKYLKEKARITISQGALLLGCVDETATLKGHFENTEKPESDTPIAMKSRLVPEVFVRLSKGANDKPQTILGPMLLARNPSLHPGDIRVVCGVDVSELHHLRDVVVLPQTGDRDVASMCSGGDLDGDDFLVMWDRDILPQHWNHEPMDYSAPEPVEHSGEITADDLATFFVNYMKNDSLARIAHAHVANADYHEQGVKDEKCLKLAGLHSKAVDYVKTGQPAQMTRDLIPPKWPHFMEKKKPMEMIYKSRKVLGQLYDQVERVDFVPTFSAPFDNRILEAYNLEDHMLDSAHRIKQEYDAHMRRIMAQQEINTEFEVWSTFVLQHAQNTNDFKYHEQIGELSGALKDSFRTICYGRAGGKDFEHIGPFAAAMYQVTSREIAEAVQECNEMEIIGGSRKPKRQMTPATMPLMSFPWLFPEILGKIAKTNSGFVMAGWKMPVQKAAPLAIDSSLAAAGQTPTKKSRGVPDLSVTGDDLKTAEGVTHHGELLELFDNSPGRNAPKEVPTSERPTLTSLRSSICGGRIASSFSNGSRFSQRSPNLLKSTSWKGQRDFRPSSMDLNELVGSLPNNPMTSSSGEGETNSVSRFSGKRSSASKNFGSSTTISLIDEDVSILQDLATDVSRFSDKESELVGLREQELKPSSDHDLSEYDREAMNAGNIAGSPERIAGPKSASATRIIISDESDGSADLASHPSDNDPSRSIAVVDEEGIELVDDKMECEAAPIISGKAQDDDTGNKKIKEEKMKEINLVNVEIDHGYSSDDSSDVVMLPRREIPDYIARLAKFDDPQELASFSGVLGGIKRL